MTHNLTQYGPGKFSFLVDALAYDASMDGCDEQCGESDTTGWYGILRGPIDPPQTSDGAPLWGKRLSEDDRAFLADHKAGAIVCEDSQGFVAVDWFSDAEWLESRWAAIVADVAAAEGWNDE